MGRIVAAARAVASGGNRQCSDEAGSRVAECNGQACGKREKERQSRMDGKGMLMATSSMASSERQAEKRWWRWHSQQKASDGLPCPRQRWKSQREREVLA